MANDRRISSLLTLSITLGLGIALSSCEPHEEILEPEPTPAQSSLVIETPVEGLESAWLLSMPDGSVVHGSGDSLLAGAPLGEYEILWEPIESWHSPRLNPESRTLTEASDETLEGFYQRIQGEMGDIEVRPEPKQLRPHWAIQGPDDFFVAGKGQRFLKRRAVGDYTVTWESVDGFVTPPSVTVRLDPDVTLDLSANYLPEDEMTGTIVIDPNPDELDAPWRLDSESGETYTGSGDQTLVDMPYGVYTLTWGDVQGYAPPSPNPITQTLGEETGGKLMIGQPDTGSPSTSTKILPQTI